MIVDTMCIPAAAAAGPPGLQAEMPTLRSTQGSTPVVKQEQAVKGEGDDGMTPTTAASEAATVGSMFGGSSWGDDDEEDEPEIQTPASRRIKAESVGPQFKQHLTCHRCGGSSEVTMGPM